jgi:carboxyl-terminal processing protease
MFKKILYSGVVLSALVVAGLIFIGSQGVSEVNAKDKDDVFDPLKLFSDVIAIVQRDYVESVGTGKLVEGAIKGMVSTLDPHSAFLTPDYYKELQVETSGEFGGLGIEITVKDGLLTVVTPIEGSPAAAVGVQAGDAIIKIEDKFTKNLSLVDAVKQMRGPKGSPIRISLMRKGVSELINVTIVRDVIKVKSVKSRLLIDGIAYVRLSQFQEHTGEEVESALEKMKSSLGDKDIRGLVLDLRNNPGGLLTQAIKVSDLFLEEGVIVYTDGRVEDQKKKFFAHSRGTEPDYPIVVLVNEGSASASEIVAGALKDHGRAIVVGTRTFGKGSVQTVLPLYNGGALRLTTALYYTKSGRSIQAAGVEPDFEVKDAVVPLLTNEEPAEAPEIRESDLPGAIRNPSGRAPASKKPAGSTPPKKTTPTEAPTPLNPETAPIPELLSSDPPLQKAVDILRDRDVAGMIG